MLQQHIKRPARAKVFWPNLAVHGVEIDPKYHTISLSTQTRNRGQRDKDLLIYCNKHRNHGFD